MTSAASVLRSDASVAGAFRARAHSAYIASRAYDAVFFILSPLLSLAIAALLTPLQWPFERTRALGDIDSRVGIFLGVFTTAHLLAVVFRSYGSPEIFARHRMRFLVVPPALFLALLVSE